jgi:uncharacterized membrane protein YhaH (DUF805 family)
MLKAIKHGLGNLANIHGRDARQAFWFYVLFLYLITFVLSMVVTMPMLVGAVISSVNEGIAQAQAGNVDDAAVEAAIQAKVGQAIEDFVPQMVMVGLVSALIMLVGLAASMVRRVHDSGLSGAWALLPLGLQAVNIALIPSQMGKLEQAMLQIQLGDPLVGMKMMEGSVGFGAMAGWGAMLAVVVLGARPSTPGPNRFGDAPFVA